MTLITEYIHIKTEGWTDIINLSPLIDKIIAANKIDHAQMVVFVVGSTTSITTIEYEPGMKVDIPDILNKITPYDGDYKHHETWGDDNGAAHVRAAIFGPSVVVPIINGSVRTGTWQQIVLIDFDTRPRNREIICQFIT